MTSAILNGFRRPLEELWTPAWDVYSEDGRFLGDVVMPPRFRPHRIRGDAVYGVERDSFDVQHVVRLRIVR